MSVRLPIFPLSAVLFPGTSLPLHIFEPRYKRMLADCLLGDRRFGLVPLDDGSEPPTPGCVGCVAEVRVNQELPDGRSNIVVLGGSRFTLAYLLDEPQPYLVGMVEPFEESTESSPTPEEVNRLRELFERYFSEMRELRDALPEEPGFPGDATSLSFYIASEITCDLGVKRRLLTERSTSKRIKALILLLPLLTSAVETGLKVHRRAHTNGKGGAMPDTLTQ
jgi:ATP-dependent Lon protease